MPSESELVRAAALLRNGGLVAIPTETVYGLAANALDAEAVARIYQVKGRPATSPLIVHVSSIEMARSLAREWPLEANILAGHFWPGPLTIVLPKRPIVPDIVTAGLDTVALRMPSHPIALEVIRRAGVPLAAPSANKFTQLSPVTAQHVREALGDDVALILDGGPCEIGIESTVVSLTAGNVVLLRPGMISRDQLSQALDQDIAITGTVEGAHPSPGMHARHYSPKTPVIAVDDGALPTGRGTYLWITQKAPAARAIHMPADPLHYAHRLYQELHEADAANLDWIAVEMPPDEDPWKAITDRLLRARQVP